MDPPGNSLTLGIAKLNHRPQDDDDDVVYAAARIVARAMRLGDGTKPGWDWIFGLGDAGIGTVLGAIEAFDSLLRWGDDIEIQFPRVKSHCGLRALWIHDRPVNRPLTLVGRMEARTMWLATGFAKRPDTITSDELGEADAITAEWMTLRR